jgi:uncharacterized membrane protein YgdD (TMEM256/DUF423 family)
MPVPAVPGRDGTARDDEEVTVLDGKVAGQKWLFLGAMLGGVGVALGAFGAHGLRGRVPGDLLAVWETASRYHLVHALALLAVAWVASREDSLAVRLAGSGFTLGIVVFSGSLYLMTLTGARWLGAVTPIGGLAFLVGWFALAATTLRRGPGSSTLTGVDGAYGDPGS